MRGRLVFVLVLALAATAGAQTKGTHAPLLSARPDAVAPAPDSPALKAAPAPGRHGIAAETFVVDISSEQSWDLLNDASNTVLQIPLGAGAVMTGIAWDVHLTALGDSWLSEARFYFDGSDQDGVGVLLAPGAGDDTPGTDSYSSGGNIDLTGAGLADIPILADGILYIQLYESYDDVADAVDANWLAGSTLTITYEPPCACPPVPAADTAAFKVGTPVFTAPDLFDVPLLASVDEDVTFSQMRIEYDSACLTFVSAVVGADVPNPGAPLVDDAPGAVDVDADRHVQLNVASTVGTYTGCDQEIFVVRFQLTGTAPCALTWDSVDGGPNSNSHLNYDNTGGGDGKIRPSGITFCDGVICEPEVVIDGTVTYYSNAEPIIAAEPDAGSSAVTVEDSGDQNPTTAASSPNGDYVLSFGAGPQVVGIAASRPMASCGSDEDGVVSGADVILMQNNPLGFADPKQQVAADVNRDGLVGVTDVLAIKRWIARKVCDGSDACEPGIGQNKNCAATWRFLFLTGQGTDGFRKDSAFLPSVCADQTLDIEGVLLGDVDGSWPELFAKPSAAVDLAIESRAGEPGEVLLALRANLDEGEALQHVIYSLSYDKTAFEYQGMQPGSGASNWGWLDNPDNPGEAHGIAHIPPQANGVVESGEIVVFRFRALRADARSPIVFTRLKANDVDVTVPEIEIGADGGVVTTTPLPTRYSVSSRPNPFNPRTRIAYTIPTGNERVPVDLRIYDISGRLVRTLEVGERGAGTHEATWDGTTDAGDAVGTGIYVLRIRAGDWSAVEKLTLLK